MPREEHKKKQIKLEDLRHEEDGESLTSRGSPFDMGPPISPILQHSPRSTQYSSRNVVTSNPHPRITMKSDLRQNQITKISDIMGLLDQHQITRMSRVK